VTTANHEKNKGTKAGPLIFWVVDPRGFVSRGRRQSVYNAGDYLTPKGISRVIYFKNMPPF
jgi:hypothetical protein